MEALWTEEADIPRFDPLEKNLCTDVLIIGGGMAGLLCAYMLRQAGVDALLTEAGRIAGGVTGKTTAKITAQHGLIYGKLLREFGVGPAKLYLRANQDALRRYRDLCAGIDCHFEERDNFVYVRRDSGQIDRELAALETLGAPAQRAERLPLPFPVAGAVKFPAQAQFNPLKFIAGIVRELHIYEHTRVLELIGTSARTERGRISAKRIIAATHFPFLNKHGAYPLKLFQQRSYVLALENAAQLNGMYVDESADGLSFRNYGELLLLGGGGHRTGKRGGGWQALRDFAARYYPGAVEKIHWATQDCMTLDGVPYIGRYGKHTQGLYVATGFNKWGMTSAMVAASLLTDMILERSSPYQALFDPARSMLRPQLARNAAEAAVSLLTPTVPRCPHLGCALKWNRQERSWDCSCHGSRFDASGRLLDGPATGGVELRRRRG